MWRSAQPVSRVSSAATRRSRARIARRTWRIGLLSAAATLVAAQSALADSTSTSTITISTGSSSSSTQCTTSFTNSAGGSWSAAANWSAGVPGTQSVACITAPGSYTVVVDSRFASVGQLIMGSTSGAGRQVLLVGTEGNYGMGFRQTSRFLSSATLSVIANSATVQLGGAGPVNFDSGSEFDVATSATDAVMVVPRIDISGTLSVSTNSTLEFYSSSSLTIEHTGTVAMSIDPSADDSSEIVADEGFWPLTATTNIPMALDGTLAVHTVGTPHPGATVTPIHGGKISGTFATITSDGDEFTAAYTASQLQLTDTGHLPVATATPTVSVTPTPTAVATATPTPTFSAIPTASPSPTPAVSVSPSVSVSPAPTGASPTATVTPTATATPTPTPIPSASATPTLSPTPMPTPQPSVGNPYAGQRDLNISAVTASSTDLPLYFGPGITHVSVATDGSFSASGGSLVAHAPFLLYGVIPTWGQFELDFSDGRGTVSASGQWIDTATTISAHVNWLKAFGILPLSGLDSCHSSTAAPVTFTQVAAGPVLFGSAQLAQFTDCGFATDALDEGVSGELHFVLAAGAH